MRNYLVIGRVEIPYPYKFEEKIEATNPGTAVNRVYRKVRKERLKGKKIKKVEFTVVAL